MKTWRRYLVLCIALLCVLGVAGCGVSHKSPEGVTESLIKAYTDGKEKQVKDCYNQKKNTEENLQAEISATIRYFQAHDMKKMKIDDCNILSEDKDYTYVYITYKLILNNDQEYPCIGTYMVGKEGKKYYVLPPSKITDDMRKRAASDYAKFMTTDSYKDYIKAYDTFMKKNPGYEEKIAGKLT